MIFVPVFARSEGSGASHEASTGNCRSGFTPRPACRITLQGSRRKAAPTSDQAASNYNRQDMKNVLPRFTAIGWLARLLGLLSACAVASIQAAPLPSSFGVWDRGEAQDPRVYPFLRGTSCDAPWNEVEKKPGVYDWSAMDQAVERAFKEKISLYFSFEAGPKTPEWVYEKGIPKVVTDNERHAGKFPHYPYYLSPEYKTYYHRFLTEVAKHIRSYPKEKQERIAFIQVKTGCTGDETPYKGIALYAYPVDSGSGLGCRLAWLAPAFRKR